MLRPGVLWQTLAAVSRQAEARPVQRIDLAGPRLPGADVCRQPAAIDTHTLAPTCRRYSRALDERSGLAANAPRRRFEAGTGVVAPPFRVCGGRIHPRLDDANQGGAEAQPRPSLRAQYLGVRSYLTVKPMYCLNEP